MNLSLFKDQLVSSCPALRPGQTRPRVAESLNDESWTRIFSNSWWLSSTRPNENKSWQEFITWQDKRGPNERKLSATLNKIWVGSNSMRAGESQRESPRAHESLRPNKIESLNSHQLLATLALVWPRLYTYWTKSLFSIKLLVNRVIWWYDNFQYTSFANHPLSGLVHVNQFSYTHHIASLFSVITSFT